MAEEEWAKEDSAGDGRRNEGHQKTQTNDKILPVMPQSSHLTNDCWELEKNEDKHPEEWKSSLDNLQDTWDTLGSGGDAPLQEAEEGTAD